MWQQILVWVITTVIGSLLAPRPQKPAAPSAGNLEVPVAEAGKPIPVLFGTRIIRQANVVWYGDLVADPIRKKGGKK